MKEERKALYISGELWSQFVEAVDIGQPKDHKPDYDWLAVTFVEQALGQYIALKQQIRKDRRQE